MLVDEVEITVKGGEGGDGVVAWAKRPVRGPEGGNGGKGGEVWVRTASDLTLLNQFTHQKLWQAQDGQRGSRKKQTGKDGKNLELVIPMGCTITDKKTDEAWELGQVGQKVKLCRGGQEGRGNFELRSSINTTPKRAELGDAGQERKIKIVLRLIADFGLIGLPNAGKSSLLNELTAAKAQVAHYPFTTLEPNLGVFNGRVIADIPGLIEGAHQGRGLGIKFLKHIEKVGTLLHCMAVDSENLTQDYRVIREELGKYNPQLLEKPEIILLTKVDLVGAKTLQAKLAQVKKLNPQVYAVSIYDSEKIEALKPILKPT